jgi:hypothetical protein
MVGELSKPVSSPAAARIGVTQGERLTLDVQAIANGPHTGFHQV